MELVYLWVEDYKNIHKQGFNFSPKFNCHYDGETLTIKDNVDEKDKKQYIENFFADNINVTAIVGKNGSGKSSIVTFLEEIDNCTSFDGDKDLKFIVCLEINNKLQTFSTLENIQPKRDVKYIDIKRIQENIDLIELDNCFFGNKCGFFTLLSEYPYSKEDRRINYDSQSIANLAIKNSNLDDSSFKLTTFMLYPKIIYLEDNTEYSDSLISEIQPPIAAYSNNPKNGSDFPESYFEIQDFSADNSLQAYMFNMIVKERSCEIFFQEYNTLDQEENLQKFYDECGTCNKNFNLQEYEQLISKKSYKLKNISKEDELLIKKYDEFLTYDFEDEKGRKFSYLSHGEKSIYGQLVSIYSKIVNEEKPSLVVFDEPDLALHPEWQRKYLFEFVNTLKEINKHIHFIVTTHSPFLLSDIPKQDIIFLDTYNKEDTEVKEEKQKVGNCRVIPHNEVMNKKQTFGANIHMLLSDSFFMEDGLMGEFAKGKINEIIDFHKEVEEENKKEKSNFGSLITRYEKKRDEFYQTQSIIGEAYLKQIVDNHLLEIDKILLGKDRAKEELVKRKEQELERLKNG